MMEATLVRAFQFGSGTLLEGDGVKFGRAFGHVVNPGYYTTVTQVMYNTILDIIYIQ